VFSVKHVRIPLCLAVEDLMGNLLFSYQREPVSARSHTTFTTTKISGVMMLMSSARSDGQREVGVVGNLYHFWVGRGSVLLSNRFYYKQLMFY